MTDYGSAIRQAFHHLMTNYQSVFCIGQGLWSPWYVGNTMTQLEQEFGRERVIDTPVSEAATTGAAVGAALAGYRPIVVHPRLDFMLLATDQIVTQAANWASMFGGRVSVPLTIRGIINRGGAQGAQHSQAFHAWFAHVPGLRVVMPATVRDARDLLIASVLSDDPVLFIDDRWLYDLEDELPPIEPINLREVRPALRHSGNAVTLVGAGYSADLCLRAATALLADGVAADVIDLRVLNPLDLTIVVHSVMKTGRLIVVDGGYQPCGLAGEVIASVACNISPSGFTVPPTRITLPFAPAPSSELLEASFYPSIEMVVSTTKALLQ